PRLNANNTSRATNHEVFGRPITHLQGHTRRAHHLKPPEYVPLWDAKTRLARISKVIVCIT
ncbi:MAG: hypothetical protein QNJ89_09255, partial [Acidimicrobiia bacterium]|nr:hypothetical protein [Acidimicrobiia bacterium]